MKKAFLFIACLFGVAIAQAQNIENRTWCTVTVCEICYDIASPGNSSYPCGTYTTTTNCVDVPHNTAPLPPIALPTKQCPSGPGQYSAWQVCWKDPNINCPLLTGGANACVIIEDGTMPGTTTPPCFDNHAPMPDCSGECPAACASFHSTSPNLEIY
jgi:hypothetical protein